MTLFNSLKLIANSSLTPAPLLAEETEFWSEYDAEQSSESRVNMVLASSIIKITGAFCGIVGCIWIIYMCQFKKILNRNTIGFLICIIAYLDIISSC